MENEIEILMHAGAPVGAPRPPPTALPDERSLRSAMFAAAASLPGEELLPYAAWLGAWHDHWPTRFGEVFGEEGVALYARLRASVQSGDRYVKLRRIAIENLANLL